MSLASHDTLAYRLTQILVKLNQGEKLDPQALAEEFSVNLRTIQRDLNVRFAYLPFEKVDGRYSLNPNYFGKLSLHDVERFAALAGVCGLFPSLSNDFLRDILDSRLQTALLVKGPHYEELDGLVPSFRQLENAILAHHHISFDYRKTEGTKSYANAQPYKLVNHDGSSDSQTIGTSDSLAKGSTGGQGLSYTSERTDKRVEEVQKHISEKLISRFQQGRSKGMFRTAIYVSAKEQATYDRLTRSVLSIFQGNESTMTPLRVDKLENTAKSFPLSLRRYVLI